VGKGRKNYILALADKLKVKTTFVLMFTMKFTHQRGLDDIFYAAHLLSTAEVQYRAGPIRKS